jgi:hypothetical protein
VLRIRDIYPGSRILIFSIRDPGPRVKRFRIRIKKLNFFNPKKWFLSLGNMFRVVQPGSGSRTRILIFYPRIPDPEPGVKKAPDPGVKKAPDPGSRGKKGTGSGSATQHKINKPCCTAASRCLGGWPRSNTSAHSCPPSP